MQSTATATMRPTRLTGVLLARLPSVALADIPPGPAAGSVGAALVFARATALLAVVCVVKAIACAVIVRPHGGARRRILAVIPATLLSLLVVSTLGSAISPIHNAVRRAAVLLIAFIIVVALETPIYFLAFRRVAGLRRIAMAAARWC